MKKHKWEKLKDELEILNYSKCMKCNIYRIIYKTRFGYSTFYTYELPEVKINGNGITYKVDDNATQVAPSCITNDEIKTFLNSGKFRY